MYLSLSYFFFLYIDKMTVGIIKTVQIGVIVPSCLQERTHISRSSTSEKGRRKRGVSRN